MQLFFKKISDYSNIKSSRQCEPKTMACLPYLLLHMLNMSESEKATHRSDSGTDSGTMVLGHGTYCICTTEAVPS